MAKEERVIEDLSSACFYDNCDWCRDPRCTCDCHDDISDDDWEEF